MQSYSIVKSHLCTHSGLSYRKRGDLLRRKHESDMRRDSNPRGKRSATNRATSSSRCDYCHVNSQATYWVQNKHGLLETMFDQLHTYNPINGPINNSGTARQIY
jgi:hypothetical protein